MLRKNITSRQSRIKNPAERKAIRRGVIAALIADSILLGILVAKNDKDYDLKKNRLR